MMNCFRFCNNFAFKFKLRRYTEAFDPDAAGGKKGAANKAAAEKAAAALASGRALHSSSFRLNLSASCGIGSASMDCKGVV